MVNWWFEFDKEIPGTQTTGPQTNKNSGTIVFLLYCYDKTVFLEDLGKGECTCHSSNPENRHLRSWWTKYGLTSWYISYESPFSLYFFSVNKIVVLLQLILPTSNKAVCRQWSKCDSSVRFLFLYMHVSYPPFTYRYNVYVYIYISSNPNIHNPTYCFKKNNQPNQLLNYIITKMYRFMPFPFSKIHFFPASTSPGTHRVHPERSRSHRSLPRLFLDLGYHVGIGNP